MNIHEYIKHTTHDTIHFNTLWNDGVFATPSAIDIFYCFNFYLVAAVMFGCNNIHQDASTLAKFGLVSQHVESL